MAVGDCGSSTISSCLFLFIFSFSFSFSFFLVLFLFLFFCYPFPGNNTRTGMDDKGLGTREEDTLQLIIDTDAGIDDAASLIFAFYYSLHPTAQKGIAFNVDRLLVGH